MTATLPGGSIHLRLNAICPYYTMFPLTFPLDHLSQAPLGDWILDPFCGRGTTNFAARLLGLPSVGIDSNPVAVAIASAKLVNVSSEDIIREAEEILGKEDEPEDVPADDFWALAYHPGTLADICRLREALLRECSSEVRVALRALVLGILHGPLRKGAPSYLSNQMPRTYATKPGAAVRFWRARGLEPPHVDVLDVIARRARYTYADLPPPADGMIVQGDSRDPALFENLPVRFRWVVTSPPYYGMRFYRSDQWLRYWFLGGDSTVPYEYDQQVGHGSMEAFVAGLAEVWKNVAGVCEPGARLVVRFGALPSLACEPRDVAQESLARADAGWTVTGVRSAGCPPRGRRQADQFLGGKGSPVEEIDLDAVLER